ncbi:MAG: hypothetical protein U0350_35195 [Caldilineaceae bacterium]
MIPSTLLQSIDELSITDKLSLIEAITQMLQHELGANGAAKQQNGVPTEKLAPIPPAQQDMQAIVAELLSRPNPPREKMLPYGLFGGTLALDEEDFRLAEWHPTDKDFTGE